MLRKKKPKETDVLDTPIESPTPEKPEKEPSFLKKHKKLVIVAAIAVVVIAVVAVRCSASRRTSAAASTNYVEAKPETRDITNTFSGDGTLSAANAYEVTSLVSGTVLTADFEVGDSVKKGDVLYTIDSSDAATSYEKAQLSLEQAQRDYDTAVDSQYVRSSIAGTLSSFKVRVGDVVSAGQEIAVIRDDSTLLLTLEFPAADAAGFTAGQSATVIVNGTFEAIVGTVESVSGTDKQGSGSLLTRTVTITVPNASGNLTSAQAAMASIDGVDSLSSAKFSYQREVTITASSAGTVEKLCVSAGSTVSRDTALVQLSDDNITKQIQNASDTLRNAEISLENAQKQLDNYTITAPIDGTIVQKSVKAGEKIQSGSSSKTLCIIYDTSYLEMTLNVDELEIRSIAVGQTASITASAVDGRTYEGTVTSILTVGSTSGGTTTYPVTVRIDTTDELMPGMNATAKITIASATGALAVPNGSVVRGNYILVTKDSPSAANAVSDMNAPDGYVYVQVTTGVSDNDYIEITSGLTAEDTIAYDSTAATLATSSSDDNQQFGGGDFGGGGGGAPGGGGPGGGF